MPEDFPSDDDAEKCLVMSEVRATSLFQKNFRHLPPLTRWASLSVNGELKFFKHPPRAVDAAEFSIHLKKQRVTLTEPGNLLKTSLIPAIASMAFILDPLHQEDASRGVLESAPGLGLVLIVPASHAATWKFELLKGCAKAEMRDKKRSRAKRWLQRVFMRSFSRLGTADFEDQGDDFKSAIESPPPCVLFQTFPEMLEAPEARRHFTPPSVPEFNSVYSYVDNITVTTPGWSLATDRDGVYAIKSLDMDTGVIRVKTTGKLPGVPPHVAFHCSYDADTRQSWDKHFIYFTAHPAMMDVPPLTDIIFAAVHAPVVADREFLEWRIATVPPKSRSKHSDSFKIYLRSCDFVDSPEVGRGRVRADVITSAYEFAWNADKSGSVVTIYSQIDIKGTIPKWIINQFAPSTPLRWVAKLRYACAEFMKKSQLQMTDPNDKLDEVCSIANYRTQLNR